MSDTLAPFHHADTGTPEHEWAGRPEWSSVPTLEVDGTSTTRLVLVAAHPDDETLGAGGLLATAAAGALCIDLVLLSAGEASHPDSPSHTPADLATLRVEETRAALALLAPSARLHLVGLPDGELGSHEDAIVEAIVRTVGEHGPTTVLAAPWRHDGHADHEAAGRAAAVAAHRTDARLVEYPIWLWHWAAPHEAPWTRFRALPLASGVRARKSHAISVHRSQVGPLSDDPGDEALLHPGMLEHFVRDRETFIVEPFAVDTVFDRVHGDAADPWRVDDSWYEERKRDLTLAALPRRRFRQALEVGCSIGALTARLATRCDAVLAVDESAVALSSAARRLRELPHVRTARGHLPEEWPDGQFDLVVVSEVGYFLSPDRLRRLIARVEASLTDDGVIVLCHWRHPVVGWPLDGPRVHELWRAASRLGVVAEHREPDFLLDLLGDTADHRQGAV
ncbi:bifunctional PIG-L family deacetylase/class I SAM-dependent methyltransferase [Humibacillus xanthopallidus]|uniref:LmbE family N-acetylglucosaminyl deacetylase n=1 Tax=Humibacillus xanthopallidus TaxID=412689 RepID=A0A543HUL3_9MICO|nr:bifunctional PIG-L family deacetylase/class I SAM-dependent methyltransferase [Humibacillus xanthopallidus]TQM62031.1 LmbE family N-acetylglucosaminyl deacetylase [Humibacillus xanthopallidus]